MRAMVILFPIFALTACGLTPEKFEQQYQDKLCEEWTACSPTFDCDAAGTTTAAVDTSSCDFDKEKASSCLNGTWTCNQDNTAFPVIELPADCLTVYTNCGEPTTGTTGTTGS